MSSEINALVLTAAALGCFHTLLGPDHYLPFIMISWAKKWSFMKTLIITGICGIGHVGSSVILGIAGVAVGIAINKIEWFESIRGNLAAWLMIGFGLAYLIWGLRIAYRNKTHKHFHFHTEGLKHEHEHNHHSEHVHIHLQSEKVNITPWVLFIVFAFGPCEPLIPLVMYPAAKNSLFGMFLVTAVFAVVTIGMMLITVAMGLKGVKLLNFESIQKYSHAIAGAAILMCGLAIQFLGL